MKFDHLLDKLLTHLNKAYSESDLFIYRFDGCDSVNITVGEYNFKVNPVVLSTLYSKTLTISELIELKLIEKV